MSRCGPNKITLLVGAPKHDQRTMCVPAVRTNRYMMAGRLAAGAAAAVASSSAAASDMAVGSVYIIYKYWGRVLEQHVLPHGRAPTAPDDANFQTEKWTVFQVQQLHPSKYIALLRRGLGIQGSREACLIQPLQTHPRYHLLVGEFPDGGNGAGKYTIKQSLQPMEWIIFLGLMQHMSAEASLT